MEVDLLHGYGFSREGDLLDLGAANNVVEKSGSWFSFGGERIGQGRENARQFLREHPEMTKKIDAAVRQSSGLASPEPLAAAGSYSRNIALTACLYVRKWRFDGPPTTCNVEKCPKNRHFLALLLFTSAVCLPYDDLDPASRAMFKQNRAAMFFRRENGESTMAEAAARMTQTQIVKELAESTGVGNKVAKQFLEKFAEMAVRETKKKGVFVMPGIGRLVRVERKARTRPQPCNRRIDQDPGQEGCEVPDREVRKRRDRSAEGSKEVVDDRGGGLLRPIAPRHISKSPAMVLRGRGVSLSNRWKLAQSAGSSEAAMPASSRRCSPLRASRRS